MPILWFDRFKPEATFLSSPTVFHSIRSTLLLCAISIGHAVNPFNGTVKRCLDLIYQNDDIAAFAYRVWFRRAKVNRAVYSRFS